MIDTWNPTQYEKFRREREQPFDDLLAMIKPADGARIVDLGCGTGRLTARLHAALRARETVGLDRSERMLATARAEHAVPGLRFEQADIRDFAAAAQYDVVFSNAALHWIEDHRSLIPRLAAALKPHGQLVFQVPSSHNDASHLVAEELTRIEPFAGAIGGWHRPQPVLEPAEYARALFAAGFAEQRVQLVVYPHTLDSRDDVVEWMKGTLLTEYARHLPDELYGPFVDAYRARLLPRLHAGRPFFFPFPRILCWGRLC